MLKKYFTIYIFIFTIILFSQLKMEKIYAFTIPSYTCGATTTITYTEYITTESEKTGTLKL